MREQVRPARSSSTCVRWTSGGAGHIPGAKHVPDHLESRIEGAAPDRSQHVILYCESGNRSAWAARTLIEDLGYEHVEHMTGGITLWKDRGYDVEPPRTLTAEQRERELALMRSSRGPAEAARREGAAARRRRPRLADVALYLAAAGVGTLGIVDNDEVDLSNLQRQVIHSNERIGMPSRFGRERSTRSTPT